MGIATRVAGVAGAAAVGMATLGGLAFADSMDNNGANLIDDNNISAVPIQLCNDNVGALLGAVVPILSPTNAQCTNAPVVDHPVAQG